MSNNKLIQQGWECPKCGGIYSPLTSKCNVCPKHLTFGTTSTSTTFLCTLFVGEPNGSTTNPKCMNCGKEIWQHVKISNTI
jgi:hypothetical protein